MARKSSIEKNKNRANKVAMHANKRSRLKAIVSNRELPIEERFRAGLKLNEMPRNGAKIRLRNRCEVSGRPRGCLLYTSPSPRDNTTSRMPSSA